MAKMMNRFVASLMPGRAAQVANEIALAGLITNLMNQVSLTARFSAGKRTAMNLMVPQLAALTMGTWRLDNDQQEKGSLHNDINYGLYGRMTGYDFRASMFNNLLADNNAYARISRLAPSLPVVRITPLANYRVVCVPIYGTDLNQYLVDGQSVSPDEILHLKLNSYDGLWGTAYEQEVRTFKLAEEAEGFAVRFYANGGNIRRVWKLIAGTDEVQRQKATDWLKEATQGRLKQHVDIVLPQLVDKPQELVSSTAKDSQMLESREHEYKTTLALYGIKADALNLEQLYQITIAPILEMVEQAFTKWVLSDSERAQYKLRYVVAGRFRGDLKSQYAMAAQAMLFQTVNEVREWFGLPSLGEAYDKVIPPNTVPAAVNQIRQETAAGG